MRDIANSPREFRSFHPPSNCILYRKWRLKKITKVTQGISNSVNALKQVFISEILWKKESGKLFGSSWYITKRAAELSCSPPALCRLCTDICISPWTLQASPCPKYLHRCVAIFSCHHCFRIQAPPPKKSDICYSCKAELKVFCVVNPTHKQTRALSVCSFHLTKVMQDKNSALAWNWSSRLLLPPRTSPFLGVQLCSKLPSSHLGSNCIWKGEQCFSSSFPCFPNECYFKKKSPSLCC